MVYPVRNPRTVTGVDIKRKQGSHHVLVQQATTTRVVRTVFERRALDLKEAVLRVRLGYVHHEKIRQQEFRQRVVPLRIQLPVSDTIHTVETGEVGVESRPVCPGITQLRTFYPST